MTCVPSSSSCGFSIIDELNRVDSWYTNDCQGPFWMLDNKCGTDCHDFGKFPKTCLLSQGNGIDGGIGRRSSGASKSSGGELGGGVGRTSISAGSLSYGRQTPGTGTSASGGLGSGICGACIFGLVGTSPSSWRRSSFLMKLGIRQYLSDVLSNSGSVMSGGNDRASVAAIPPLRGWRRASGAPDASKRGPASTSCFGATASGARGSGLVSATGAAGFAGAGAAVCSSCGTGAAFSASAGEGRVSCWSTASRLKMWGTYFLAYPHLGNPAQP